MPLYEYECLANHHSFEVRHPITQDPIAECPQCGSPVRRIIHPVGIVFKGSGFYATDSRGKGSTTSTKPAETTSETKSNGEGKSKPTETKSEPPQATGSKTAGSGDSKASG